ncbi:Sulfotransfer_2 domain-containing protein [Cephalotus follicularis]|uniref:Sulfotransfer_2 domain-containing protein n=1 Tax=Cephalotus follicularis TaxID=3775 RepID=A0A1Q3BEY8_CEPFO|nr:Sulfotransfer_2 domain-containing protein [Cephalotus follicularis]
MNSGVAIRWMDPPLKVTVLLMLLGLVNASLVQNDFGHCERIVQSWASSALDPEAEEDKHTLRDLLFFLHVPRTGGRTYFHCFLKKLYSSSDECPRSYDKLRFDPSKTKCKLLVTHDDYSMMSKLPRRKTSVVTILRNPIDRVFSTYEFSIEVGARFLVHPNLTSATQMAGRLRAKTNGVSTLDIWPWKYLVPWMREDLFARRDANKHRGLNEVESSDSYNMKDIVMPLHDYINDPIAHDIVHNGETFQVAGLTNNSYLAEAHEVRHCVQQYKMLGEHVLRVAKKRLDDMLYVGLTEDHRESATMFANVVGAQVLSQQANMGGPPNNESGFIDLGAGMFCHLLNSFIGATEHSSSHSDTEPDDSDDQSSTFEEKASDSASNQNVEVKKKNMTVEELIKAYEVCISGLRKTQSRRRTSSLKRISPANFSKEARLRVSEEVLQQIRSLNNLDWELYKYAQDLFAKQHEKQFVSTERLEKFFNNSYGITCWGVFSLAMSIMLLILLIFLCVNARRRTSKVKI